MSREERLKRLGLWHLRDDPEALKLALEKQAAERQTVEQAHDAERVEALRQLLREQGVEVPPYEEPHTDAVS